MDLILMILSLLEFVVAIASSAICCAAVCCGRSAQSGIVRIIQYNVYYNACHLQKGVCTLHYPK